MRIYLDVCCFNRIFDDHSQNRIRLEAVAISDILLNCNLGLWQLVSSEFVEYEIRNCRNQEKKDKLLDMNSVALETISLNEEINQRSINLENDFGFGTLDSLHISCAEYAKVDVFITTDDSIISIYNRSECTINLKIMNPVSWYMENKNEIDY